MALTKVSGRVAYPYGKDGELESLDGTILYTRIGGGSQDGAVTVPAQKRVKVTRSVAEETELGVGVWNYSITPSNGRSIYNSPTPIVVDGTVLEIDLHDYAPVVVVDGEAIARGKDGASAYDLAGGDAEWGSLERWLASLGGGGGGPVTVVTDGDGTYTLTRDGSPVNVTTDGDGTYRIGA